MLRSRILAAATAAVLMLGISVGGASAALATPPQPPPVPAGVTITDDNGVTCNGIGYTKPPSLDNIEGGTGSATFDWGVFSWSGSVASWTINPGWTVDLCVKGGSTWPLAEIDLGVFAGSSYTHPQSISHLGYRATPPVVEPSVATASISPVPADCDDPTTWNIAGGSIANARWGSPFVDGSSLVIVATATGGALFAAGEGVSGDRTTKTFSTPYEEAGVGDCGPPEVECVVVVWEMPSWVNGTTPTWPQDFVAVYPFDCDEPVDAPVPDDCDTQYQLDKYFDSDITDALIAGGFLNGPNNPDEDLVPGGWGSSYKLVKNPDCEPPTLPTINVTASSIDFTCERPSGSFTVGLGLAEENGSKLLWSTSMAGDPDLPGTVPVTEAGVITVTVDVLEEFAAEYGLNDESGLGVVDPVTGAITYTFTFAEPDDCPTLDGSTASSQCEQDAPYLVWSLELTDPGSSISFPTTAALTLRDTSNPANTYTFPDVAIAGPGTTGGSALWPGAAVDGDGNGTAWPGWAFVGGEWVVDDSNFGWVRGDTVELLVEVNPEIALVVSYPDATPDCANPPVVVPEVTVVDICVGSGNAAVQTATFTVTRAANVNYSYTVNGGSPIAISFDGDDTETTISVSPLDMVVVTASPADGFRLADGYEPFSYSFIGSAFCPGTFPATEAAAVIEPGDCESEAPGTVTLTNEGGVIWTLNGEVVPGNSSYPIELGESVLLTAALEGPSDEYPGGWTWSDPEQQTVWTYDGSTDDECLLSLAFTGADSATAWLGGAAVVMMLVGMGAVIRRRSVEI